MSGLSSSESYTIEMSLPVVNLNDSNERWGIYFYGNELVNKTSLNIKQFGNIPIASDGNQFRGFKGRIEASDAPSIRVGTSLENCFRSATWDGQKYYICLLYTSDAADE